MYVIFHNIGTTHRQYLKKNTEDLFNPKLSLAHAFVTREEATQANKFDLWIAKVSKKRLFEARLKGI